MTGPCPSCRGIGPDPDGAVAFGLLVGLGHDGQAHRIYRVLLRHGIRTLAALETATDEDLLKLHNLGPGMLARIRTRIPAPYSRPGSGKATDA